MRSKTKSLTLIAVLVAVMLLFGFTPLGYIPIGVVQITLMCIPVIIGTIVLGLKTGLFLCAVFAITSFVQVFTSASIFNVLFFQPENWYDPILFILVLVVPRMLIAPGVHFLYKAVKINKTPVRVGICAAAGSAINTVIFLSMMNLFFAERINGIIMTLSLGYVNSGEMMLIIGATNGLPEIAACVIICTPIIMALSKIYKKQEKTA